MIQQLAIRPMELSDIEPVLEIERRSFPTPWSRNAFLSELCDNRYGYYLVGEVDGQVVAYGGIWTVVNEAHITTIAVHPDYRGQSWGEEMLIFLAQSAVIKGAEKMTLEVRKSNGVAQMLYEKFGFQAAGIRKGYYLDTNEDAIIMWKDLDLPRE